jgi:DNA repair exonuclease SbcCD ATPase subunit
LKADPSKSDRQIAEQTKTSPTTVGKVRAEKEASGDVSKVDTRTDTKGRKQPSSKPQQQTVAAAAAEKQVEAVIAKLPASWDTAEPTQTPEELRAELAEARDSIAHKRAELERITDPTDADDIAWQEASTEIEELHAEIERLKKPPEAATACPAVSYLEKPWLAAAAEAARGPAPDPADFNPDAVPLVDLEKQLESFIAQLDVVERAAADLIHYMVDQRKQSVRSVAKLIGKDPKWVKEKFDLAKPVTEAPA